MSERKGTISVATSDIFPIIKKWLYSEHDIFLRELVANATDAITKRATLARTRNEEIPTGKISVVVDKDNKTIKISDFMPYPIAVSDLHRIAEDKKHNEKMRAEGKDEKDIYPVEEESIVNETRPLWKKDPKDISDDDYKAFFRKLYPMEPEPLFWLHLNVDHPFTLEGILFFPKINPTKPFNDSNIKLYCKQVFVSDNVKNIIPEFLSLLKGTIDSPDIPLNVSRSALQGDPNVKKIANYVVKKVAEGIKKLANSDRERFEKVWEDIG